MLQLDISFDQVRVVSGAEFANVYWNVGANGLAAGAIDTDAPVNAAPVQLYPGETAGSGPSWGAGAWGMGFWSGDQRAPSGTFRTPAVCFGRVVVGARAVDAVGNEQSGAIAEAEQVVNSTPRPPTNLRRGELEAGRLALTFTPSPQVV